jgi:glucokinase
LYSKKYINNDYDQFDEILTNFIQDTNLESFDCISLACEAPIIDNKVHFSNIKWIIDKEDIEKTYSIKVFLMNEFDFCSHSSYIKAFQETL